MKVLVILTGGIKRDGITTVWLNYLDAISHNTVLQGKVEIDFAVMSGMAVDSYVSKLKEYGCGIIELPNRKKSPLAYFDALRKKARQGKYDAIHANGSSSIMAIEMSAAWLAGVRRRISHSHNTVSENMKLHKFLLPFFHLFCNERIACGREAGEFLFEGRPFTIMTNGQNLEKYKFNPFIREQQRARLGLNGRFVIGHVGGINYAKNHEFMLKIVSELKKLRSDVLLYLVGDGVLGNQIRKQTKEMGLDNYVTFAGLVDDVPDRLQAMDLMILPSRFEGLPNVILEWQAAGLHCLMSDVVTKDCAPSRLVESLSLDQGPVIWAQKLFELSKMTQNRASDCSEAVHAMKDAGFDINDNARKLVELYLSNQ